MPSPEKGPRNLSNHLRLGLKAIDFSWRLTLAGALATAGVVERVDIAHASTAETFPTVGTQVIQEIGSVSLPILTGEYPTVVTNINSEISRKQTAGNSDSDPNYLSNNTNNYALVLDATIVSAYSGNNAGRSIEQDIITTDEELRTKLANAGVISPATNVVTSTAGAKTTFLMTTNNVSVSAEFPRWDNPTTFVSNGNNALDGYVVPSSLTGSIMSIEDQILRDGLRLPPAHYSNVTSSNFDISMGVYSINTSLKTVQVHTDAKVTIGTGSAVLINNGTVEQGNTSLPISPNHTSLLLERQRTNKTHNNTKNAYESYNQPFDFKNIQINLKPIDGSGNDRTFNPALTKIIPSSPVPANGKSGKIVQASNLRTPASASSPTGAEMFDALPASTEDADPRGFIAYVGFDVGTGSETWGVIPGVNLSYAYRKNINSGTGQLPTSFDARVKTYASGDTVDSDYLNTKISNVVLTALPTNTPTVTRTSTPTATLTASSTATETETASPTATRTSTSTETPTGTVTVTRTVTMTETPSGTATTTMTETVTATRTPTGTVTVTETETHTATPTSTFTHTLTRTATPTPSGTLTITASSTITTTPSGTETVTVSPTGTVTRTFTPTPTPTITATPLPTPIQPAPGGGGQPSNPAPVNTPIPQFPHSGPLWQTFVAGVNNGTPYDVAYATAQAGFEMTQVALKTGTPTPDKTKLALAATGTSLAGTATAQAKGTATLIPSATPKPHFITYLPIVDEPAVIFPESYTFSDQEQEEILKIRLTTGSQKLIQEIVDQSRDKEEFLIILRAYKGGNTIKNLLNSISKRLGLRK